MKFSRIAAAFAVSLMAATPALADDVQLTGSGASFPFPLYSAWFKQINNEDPSLVINYQSKGSGAGIQDFTNKVVDFAASDAAMSDKEIEAIKEGVVLAPMTAGEIVLSYNLDGVKELKLPSDVYPDIFLGKIKKWNDPRIAKANEGIELPDTPITVVVRSDSSGTTFNFTNHLAAISNEFKDGPGAGKTVQWPSISSIVKAPKNDGVTATIKQTPGAIGYIEYGYAKLTKMPAAMLQNAAGNYVAPGAEAGAKALESAVPDMDDYLRVFITNPKGEGAYPIATFTWMLFYKSGQDADKVEGIKKMVEWGLTKGQEEADKYGYIPLPDAVKTKIREAMETIKPAAS